jgi:hypothetical protein
MQRIGTGWDSRRTSILDDNRAHPRDAAGCGLLPHAGIEECFFVKFDQAGALLEFGASAEPL